MPRNERNERPSWPAGWLAGAPLCGNETAEADRSTIECCVDGCRARHQLYDCLSVSVATPTMPPPPPPPLLLLTS